MKRVILISAIIATLAVGAVSYATFASRTVHKAPTHVTAQVLKAPTQQELLDAVNTERAKVGVAPLVLDERLNKSAQVKADDMVANNYFDHIDNNGKHGYQYVGDYDKDCEAAGENLSWSTFDKRTAAGVVSGWISSEGHYKAMVNSSYTTTGFGISFGEKMIIVEHFCQLK